VACRWHGSQTSQHDGRLDPAGEREVGAGGVWDAAVVDEALAALLARHREADLDASYEARAPSARRAGRLILEPGDDLVAQALGGQPGRRRERSTAVQVERLGRLADQRPHQICAALEVAADCEQ
jgi:hypothetical protein